MSEGTAVIVGTGRVGLSLAAGLMRSGGFTTVVAVGRNRTRPGFLRDFDSIRYAPGLDSALAWLNTSPEEPTVVVFAVADDALAGLAAEWAERLPRDRTPGALIALHTSGFHPSSLIEPLARLGGASLGSWHPLTALAEPGLDAFAGVTIGVEGDAPAIEWARTISRRLGATPVEIPAGGKARYHAAAVFASNYLVANLRVALSELAAACGGSVDEAALLPLARAALENVARHGIVAGTTGPLVRGDVHTVAGHLEALDPTRAALYRALGRELLEVARERNPAEVYEALSALLAG